MKRSCFTALFLSLQKENDRAEKKKQEIENKK